MKIISNQTTDRPKTSLKIRRYGGNRLKFAALPDNLSIDQTFQLLRQVAVLPEEDEVDDAWRRMESLLIAKPV